MREIVGFGIYDEPLTCTSSEREDVGILPYGVLTQMRKMPPSDEGGGKTAGFAGGREKTNGLPYSVKGAPFPSSLFTQIVGVAILGDPRICAPAKRVFKASLA